jgi:GTPase Era involved in 16S rRNA processing
MKSQINVMILGQSGVGKSSLINYLAGKKIVEVGTGKPVTPKGKFDKVNIPSPLKPDTAICIFDSWGLESNQGEVWKEVINEKLDSSLSFDDMVYGIIYCMSYSSGRIQDFEIKMLKELLAKQYKVIIAATNADSGNYEEYKTVYREKLAKELPEFRDVYTVVDICAEAKPKLGQSAANVVVFGKEVLFKELEDDVSDNFEKVVFAKWTAWKDNARAQLKDFKQEGTARIIEFKRDGIFGTKLPFGTKLHTANTINEALEQELKTMTTNIFEKIKDGMNDAQQLYEHFTGAFFKTERSKELVAKYFFNKIGLQIDQAVHFGTKKLDLQQELAKDLDNAVSAIDDKVLEIYDQAKELLVDLKYKRESERRNQTF